MTDDARPLLVMRRGSMLVPVAPLDSDAIMEFPAGKPLRARLTQPRNVQRLRLYWSLIGLIADNIDGVSREALHDAIKVRLGYFDTVTFKGSEPIHVPKSIAFDEMTEEGFKAFLDKFTSLVRERIIPGIDKADFTRHALEMLGEAA